MKKNPSIHITAITRPTSTYTPAEDSNITHRTADYTSIHSLAEAFSGQHAVVNCITGGATQYDPTKLIIDAAVSAGVKFYFANEFVGYVDAPQYRRLPEAFVGSKFRIREYLAELAGAGNIAWTSLNGGPFFDMWLMKGPAGFDIANKKARIYGTGNNNLFWTPLPTMAQAVANMLQDPGAVANRPIYICPFTKGELTQRTLMTTLERILDSTFSIKEVDVAKINKHAKIALERGEAGKAMKGFAVSNQFFEEDSGNDFSHLTENETAGIKTMSVEEAVRDAIERYGQDCPVVEGMFMVEPCEI